LIVIAIGLIKLSIIVGRI